MSASAQSIEAVQRAARAAESRGADDLVALDVSGPLPFADCFLLATGAVERTVNAIADSVEDAMLEQGVKVLRREGRSEGRWVLLDFGDIVVHVFHQEDRAYYSLERLWKDCPIVPLQVLQTESRA